MADTVEIVFIIYDGIESPGTGLVLYKDHSPTGESKDHITVRSLGLSYQDCVNKAPVVNVNIFIRKHENGMNQRQRMSAVKKDVLHALENITVSVGMYWSSRVVWSESLDDAKEGFQCENIRVEVITEK